jgi:5-hydroxyisourate hydrolase
MSVSTHVLDTVTGRPAVGVLVVLEKLDEQADPARWTLLAERLTDPEGRIADFASSHPTAAGSGNVRLRFDTGGYFRGETFYPEVIVTFAIKDPAAHHHVPLLLSPYGYSTYRGS